MEKIPKAIIAGFPGNLMVESIAVFMEYISMHQGRQGVNSGLVV